jgi:hypothetical protein
VATVGRLSDALVRLGPWSIGLDGIFSWVPGLGEVYAATAGGFILVQGVRAGVSPRILLVCAGMVGLRTAGVAVPLAGPVFADIFLAHRWSARLIVGAIDRKLGRAEPSRTWGLRRAAQPA